MFQPTLVEAQTTSSPLTMIKNHPEFFWSRAEPGKTVTHSLQIWAEADQIAPTPQGKAGIHCIRTMRPVAALVPPFNLSPNYDLDLGLIEEWVETVAMKSSHLQVTEIDHLTSDFSALATLLSAHAGEKIKLELKITGSGLRSFAIIDESGERYFPETHLCLIGIMLASPYNLRGHRWDTTKAIPEHVPFLLEITATDDDDVKARAHLCEKLKELYKPADLNFTNLRKTALYSPENADQLTNLDDFRPTTISLQDTKAIVIDDDFDREYFLLVAPALALCAGSGDESVFLGVRPTPLIRIRKPDSPYSAGWPHVTGMEWSDKRKRREDAFIPLIDFMLSHVSNEQNISPQDFAKLFAGHAKCFVTISCDSYAETPTNLTIGYPGSQTITRKVFRKLQSFRNQLLKRIKFTPCLETDFTYYHDGVGQPYYRNYTDEISTVSSHQAIAAERRLRRSGCFENAKTARIWKEFVDYTKSVDANR